MQFGQANEARVGDGPWLVVVAFERGTNLVVGQGLQPEVSSAGGAWLRHAAAVGRQLQQVRHLCQRGDLCQIALVAPSTARAGGSTVESRHGACPDEISDLTSL